MTDTSIYEISVLSITGETLIVILVNICMWMMWWLMCYMYNKVKKITTITCCRQFWDSAEVHPHLLPLHCDTKRGKMFFNLTFWELCERCLGVNGARHGGVMLNTWNEKDLLVRRHSPLWRLDKEYLKRIESWEWGGAKSYLEVKTQQHISQDLTCMCMTPNVSYTNKATVAHLTVMKTHANTRQ